MTEAAEKPRWKNGFWKSLNNNFMITKVTGEKSESYYLVVLDYPDAKPIQTGVWKYGDFGPAKPKIVEATGVQNYNMGNIFLLNTFEKGLCNRGGWNLLKL